ncbi:MAG TPA: methyltransferase domain-containing protein [Candidatus Limnocylindria bacterium]|jgi:SAM-dependent methyltransferase
MRPIPRSTQRELLDEPDVDPSELRRNLSEMAMLNRLPGGVDASVAATLRLLPGEADGSGRVLDVGAGAADFARRLRRRSRAAIVLVDVSPRVLDSTRAAVAGMARVEVREADARDLPMPDGAVDVAHASLLLHHLDPRDATAALAEMGRVARAGVVVNDLRRGRLALAMTAAPILAFARSPMTRHDGILSSRRAYTLHELDDLAATAGLRPTARTTRWWPRVTTTYR